MLLKEFFSHANWLAIGVAAIAYFVLGALWFSVLFRKAWMAGHNIQMPTTDAEKEKVKKGMPMLMITTLLMNIIVAIVVGMVVMAMGAMNCMAGIKLGLGLSVIGAIPLIMGDMYLMKPLKVWFVDGAYHITGITLMTIIISVWH